MRPDGVMNDPDKSSDDDSDDEEGLPRGRRPGRRAPTPVSNCKPHQHEHNECPHCTCPFAGRDPPHSTDGEDGDDEDGPDPGEEEARSPGSEWQTASEGQPEVPRGADDDDVVEEGKSLEHPVEIDAEAPTGRVAAGSAGATPYPSDLDPDVEMDCTDAEENQDSAAERMMECATRPKTRVHPYPAEVRLGKRQATREERRAALDMHRISEPHRMAQETFIQHDGTTFEERAQAGRISVHDDLEREHESQLEELTADNYEPPEMAQRVRPDVPENLEVAEARRKQIIGWIRSGWRTATQRDMIKCTDVPTEEELRHWRNEEAKWEAAGRPADPNAAVLLSRSHPPELVDPVIGTEMWKIREATRRNADNIDDEGVFLRPEGHIWTGAEYHDTPPDETGFRPEPELQQRVDDENLPRSLLRNPEGLDVDEHHAVADVMADLLGDIGRAEEWMACLPKLSKKKIAMIVLAERRFSLQNPAYFAQVYDECVPWQVAAVLVEHPLMDVRQAFILARGISTASDPGDSDFEAKLMAEGDDDADAGADEDEVEAFLQRWCDSARAQFEQDLIAQQQEEDAALAAKLAEMEDEPEWTATPDDSQGVAIGLCA